MEITWLGHSCFQIRGKQVTLVTDPYTPLQGSSEGEQPRLSQINARIVTVSHNHPGHNNVSAVGGTPYIVRGPGEYEISDVLITGVASFHDKEYGKKFGRNTIYVIHMDDLVICHLGDLGHTLQETQLEAVADADVLLLPVGGEHVINAAQAAEVISQIEPRIVVPMHYTSGESQGVLETFCKEMGIETITPQPKLVVTPNTLPTETQVVILTSHT
ncbi:L-ascorbate metabolism protein UlaG (beta-lactamase superfamily) [Thermosporothrix hazakensis]|jgi:L-ascorbate metabolism protein UlaG (beta-lactamase superfamily)|uniref:L-ascorbate metabolism protein UlaG (Beta-lactamase superfamily) n=2 Tax=Thermosporothrix TaxID=768650 RepID=A0A326TUK6_THEHA|nr:MBL fold metallo-hydrolase [Thermosporothrix hazakensis]PZW19709.1 L-ascorbate metabolism protein UlaG (beta-lactamase superfamily) [Thermosporothrix hazakensis]BBH90526.1 Zn-dependent hydrolase [Thermosporothrix sp. COM3]GCE48579.1 Zn-dependent hydrolase [Thermosporothrix hazakensis]